jgi:hypothetical protein
VWIVVGVRLRFKVWIRVGVRARVKVQVLYFLFLWAVYYLFLTGPLLLTS